MLVMFLFPGCPSSRSWVCSGSFTSPYYPSSYAHSWNCYWVITVPSGYRVKLEFHTFYLRRYLDFLQIRDGSSSYSPQIGAYRGHYSAFTVSSSGTSLWFRFFVHPNGAGAKGFNATYTAVPSYSKYNIRLSKLRGL